MGCGLCVERCRFQAIRLTDGVCQVNEYACEGCGVCAYVCPQEAVILAPDRAGQQELYLEDGVFSTAALKMGRGNSGKLVTQVKLDLLKHAPETDLAILDGSPGIGCPVIASVSGMDLVLVVAEPSQSGLSDLKRLAATAEALQARIAVCVNKWDVSPAHTQAIREFCTAEGIPLWGRSPMTGGPLRPSTKGRVWLTWTVLPGTLCTISFKRYAGCWGSGQENSMPAR